jgi:hypothetical protein
LNDERAVAVIAEAKKLVPNKPIKYLVNTHNHLGARRESEESVGLFFVA